MRQPPYLPFLDGPPRFQVALKPIELAAWLHPDSEAHSLSERHQHLSQPQTCYRAHQDHTVSEQEAARCVLYALEHKDAGTGSTLLDAAPHVSDDLIVLMPMNDTGWTVTSLVMTSPTFFSVDHAFMGGLEFLHGPVPDGQRLTRRIARVFDNLPEDQILERFRPVPTASRPVASPCVNEPQRLSRKPQRHFFICVWSVRR